MRDSLRSQGVLATSEDSADSTPVTVVFRNYKKIREDT